MKKSVFILMLILLLGILCSCTTTEELPQIAATTLPVYDFTVRLCQGTDITVGRVVAESVSCLHDYSLQTGQMRLLEGAELVVISGAGLEDFLDDALRGVSATVDASSGIEQICAAEAHGHNHEHGHEGHNHDQDPHIWLSPENAKIMARNICDGLCDAYPEQGDAFHQNLDILLADLDALQQYAEESLSQLSCRQIITFHDGFAYFAESFDLTILSAVEEESGSEASAAELIELVQLVEHHSLPAVFIERNGSVSAADIIATETGCAVFTLDMAMSGESYFDAMYNNINTIKEALG